MSQKPDFFLATTQETKTGKQAVRFTAAVLEKMIRQVCG